MALQAISNSRFILEGPAQIEFCALELSVNLLNYTRCI